MNDKLLPPSLKRLRNITVDYDRERQILWYWLKPDRPCVTRELLDDMRTFQDEVCAWQSTDKENVVSYLVGGSKLSGVFNLGGDLAYFIHLIKEKDRGGLSQYARSCVEVLYRNVSNLQLPLTTISLVQGDALGGGFEAVLSSNVVIAERSARMGFPEILFNLLPGMGAYSLLFRRVGRTTTERVLTTGTHYTAEQLHAMGVVDVLCDKGYGVNKVVEYVTDARNRRNATRLLAQMRERVSPITLTELTDVVDLWTEAAMNITGRDLRLMERLASMQTTVGRAEPDTIPSVPPFVFNRGASLDQFDAPRK